MARVAIGADDKKKLYVLGALLAGLALVGGVLYFPRGGSKPVSTTDTSDVPERIVGAPAADPLAPGMGAPGAPATTASASVAPGGVNAASLISLGEYRDDPFERFAKPVLPPIPTPAPPPPPVVILPPDQVDILPPSQFGSGSDSGLPPMGINASRIIGSPGQSMVGLPPVALPTRLSIPTTPAPPAGQGSGAIQDSPNKRISGVIIGDSVRALLEISDGETTTTRIVQPGDEVDGIRILRIERVTEGNRTITRAIIRENGEERSVPLKAAPRDANAGAGGIGGFGGPGMPGAPRVPGGRGAFP